MTERQTDTETHEPTIRVAKAELANQQYSLTGIGKVTFGD